MNHASHKLPSCSSSADGGGKANDRHRTLDQGGRPVVGRWPYAVEPTVQTSMPVPGREPPGSTTTGYGIGGGKRVWSVESGAGGGFDSSEAVEVPGGHRENDALRKLAMVAMSARKIES